MSTLARGALAGSLIFLVLPTIEAQARSKSVRAEFQRLHPCPATAKPRGPCAGYVTDHVVPLCAGGADHHSNMQWQTAADARVKDRAELTQCRRRLIP